MSSHKAKRTNSYYKPLIILHPSMLARGWYIYPSCRTPWQPTMTISLLIVTSSLWESNHTELGKYLVTTTTDISAVVCLVVTCCRFVRSTVQNCYVHSLSSQTVRGFFCGRSKMSIARGYPLIVPIIIL